MAQRDLLDMSTKDFGVVDYNGQNLDDTTFHRDEDVSWTRSGVDGGIVENNSDDDHEDINDIDD